MSIRAPTSRSSTINNSGSFAASSLPSTSANLTPSTSLNSTVRRFAIDQSNVAEELTLASSSPSSSSSASSDDFLHSVDARLKALERGQSSIKAAVDELKTMLKASTTQSFAIKGSVYESQLKSEMAALFCQSLKREPSDDNVVEVVEKVLTRQIVNEEKHKFDAALRFCKSKLVEFRTEERRKCLGIHPYAKCCTLTTEKLCTSIMEAMGSRSPDNHVTYIRHLALFRSFVRHCSTLKQATHKEFRTWLDSYYNSIDEDKWEMIMSDDLAYDYAQLGHGIIVQE